MIRAIKRLLHRNEKRYELVQLSHEARQISDGYSNKMKHERNAERRNELYQDMRSELGITEFQIDEIETRLRLDDARRYGVPIPTTKDDRIWFENHGHWHLTDHGHQHLRHEVARERELLWRPWLAWSPLAISAISLVVSLAAFLSK